MAASKGRDSRGRIKKGFKISPSGRVVKARKPAKRRK